MAHPNDLRITEPEPTEELIGELIRMSEDWEAEDSCYGYRKNEQADIDGNRIFLAKVGSETAGYLFGHLEKASRSSSIMEEGTVCFELEELYVRPAYRDRGIGRALFEAAERAFRGQAEYLMVGTATKNWKAILHFYIEELGMEFWSARLFKKL